jgi:hypothetical protein
MSYNFMEEAVGMPLSVSPTPHSISTHLVQAAEQSRRKVHRFNTQKFVVRVGRTMATAAGRAPALLHPSPRSSGSCFSKISFSNGRV